VPLYYSDKWFVRDFNPLAAINRNDFASLEKFVEYVASVNASPSKFDELLSAPLLVERPTIDPAVNFLREACETILHN
jgi:hypothetical protein